MQVRMPRFDFSQSTARWIPRAPEMAQLLNANSIVIPHLERFLNKVMARARAQITGDDPRSVQVRRDISTFIKQESCHYTIHSAFNAMMVRDGYDDLPTLEKAIVAHYDRLLATRSLPFLLAYCEGFESLTPPVAGGWFDGSMKPILKNADPEAAAMWRWHIMEEFEHRTVCHDAFALLHGGYLLRVYAFFYQFVALERMVGRVYRYLLQVDRQSMSVHEARQSRKNARRSVIGFFRPIMGGLLKVLHPRYSPADIPEPAGWADTRDDIERNRLSPVPVGSQA